MSISQPVIPPASSTPVRAVLLDADGVLQFIGTPWGEALTQGGGPAFAQAMIDGETDALAGRETLTELLERVVGSLGLELRASDLLEMWHRATPDPVAWQLVRDLREAGYTTVLATNQQWERRAWMREQLGYDGLCDIDGYSCTLGVAKPDAAYFHRLLELARWRRTRPCSSMTAPETSPRPVKWACARSTTRPMPGANCCAARSPRP